MTGKRVHTGEEWVRSLERRLSRLESGRTDDSRWVGRQRWVPTWYGTCADTSLPTATAVHPTAWTTDHAYRIADPVAGEWFATGTGLFSFTFRTKFSAAVGTSRAFIELEVGGGAGGYYRQSMGNAEQYIGATWIVPMTDGQGAKFRLYQATGSTLTAQLVVGAVARISVD